MTWLEKLVAFDTRNGTGDEIACAQFLADAFQTFSPDEIVFETVPRSRGKSDSGFVMARWGRPDMLLNVHIDTVPSGRGWTADPLTLRDMDDRVIGLGTSDIKGAAACILAALETVQAKNVAVLFSGDEEHGSEVMPAVIARGHLKDVKNAIICEPTSCRVGRKHRGMLALSAHFSGPGGHSSLSDDTSAPLLQASRLAAAIGDYGEAHRTFGTPPFQGLCTNIGDLETDGSYNVIPTSAELKFSLRPPPGDDVAARETDLRRIAKETGMGTELDRIVALQPFASQNSDLFEPVFADQFDTTDLPYWTEAALISAAGKNAVVYGPGNLDQAHKPNEYVEKAQLSRAIEVYARALEQGL